MTTWMKLISTDLMVKLKVHFCLWSARKSLIFWAVAGAKALVQTHAMMAMARKATMIPPSIMKIFKSLNGEAS